MNYFQNCKLCPRNCGADRYNSYGYCGCGAELRIARCALHFWEEPCISGKNGSGAVFFSGCPLKCVFCQNNTISSDCIGKNISVSRLSDVFLELKAKGAHNINLVSPTQFVPLICSALENVKGSLDIPVVYNTGGYEKTETLKLLDGLVDIYLPDIKYFGPEKSRLYSNAPDYFEYASLAVKEMFRQTGKYNIDNNGMLIKGVLIRHLVLPSSRLDSLSVINWISANFKSEDVLLSIMSQYTPPTEQLQFKELNRRICLFEYGSIVKKVSELGFDGYIQDVSAAKKDYIPDFNMEGV